MKKVFTMLVAADDTARMEEALNSFQIGRNDWDRTRALDVSGASLVNYTIVCEESVFTSIVQTMNGVRVY